MFVNPVSTDCRLDIYTCFLVAFFDAKLEKRPQPAQLWFICLESVRFGSSRE